MRLIRKIFGPRSKYDKSIPYTYEARVDLAARKGFEPLTQHYFSDTLCGLIETLEGENYEASQVKLFGVFRGEEFPLDTDPCLDEGGAWLHRPELCRSLEKTYAETLEARYRGHVEKGHCSYEDRDRRGVGPM